MTLSRNLKRLRRKAGLSLRALEHETGLSNAYLSQLENGVERNPTLMALTALAKFYEMTIDELVK